MDHHNSLYRHPYPSGPSEYYQRPSPPPPPPPSQEYQQHGYPIHSHYGPPQHPSQHPSHSPQQYPGHISQDSFRYFYSNELRALTFNSKPIITHLTMIANDYSLKMAPVVVQCIEEWLRNCPPHSALPGLYLLDSICKNLGHPYVSLFSHQIVSIFLSIYHNVDDGTKIKMEELLGTWKTGGARGADLFPPHVQQKIKDTLFGKNGRGGISPNQNYHFMTGVRQQPGIATEAERAYVLQEVRRVLDMRLSKQAANPSDVSNSGQIQVLQKIKAVVQDEQITSEQAQQIIEQLAAHAPREQTETQRPIPPSLKPLVSVLDKETLSRAASASGDEDISEALKTLDPNVLKNLVGLSKTQNDPAQDAYDADVINFNVALNNADIQKPRRDAYHVIYHRVENVCNQCGARYTLSEMGKARKIKHLDWHFKHTKGWREATRAQGRAWFVDEDEWLHPSSLNPKAIENEDDDEEEEKVPAQESIVVRPADPKVTSRPCPICQEGFHSEFRESEEEWFWTDATLIDGVYYHASCHSETVKLRIAALKLKEEASARNSRENTPTIANAPNGDDTTTSKTTSSTIENPSETHEQQNNDADNTDATVSYDHGDEVKKQDDNEGGIIVKEEIKDSSLSSASSDERKHGDAPAKEPQSSESSQPLPENVFVPGISPLSTANDAEKTSTAESVVNDHDVSLQQSKRKADTQDETNEVDIEDTKRVKTEDENSTPKETE